MGKKWTDKDRARLMRLANQSMAESGWIDMKMLCCRFHVTARSIAHMCRSLGIDYVNKPHEAKIYQHLGDKYARKMLTELKVWYG